MTAEVLRRATSSTPVAAVQRPAATRPLPDPLESDADRSVAQANADAAHVVVRALVNNGVRRAIVSPGSRSTPLAVALGPGLNRLGAALVLTGLYGAGLEVAQMVGDAGREGSLLDIAANLSGAMAGLVLVAILRGDRPLFRRDNC